MSNFSHWNWVNRWKILFIDLFAHLSERDVLKYLASFPYYSLSPCGYCLSFRGTFWSLLVSLMQELRHKNSTVIGALNSTEERLMKEKVCRDSDSLVNNSFSNLLVHNFLLPFITYNFSIFNFKIFISTELILHSVNLFFGLM